jgi:hypothetical protein
MAIRPTVKYPGQTAVVSAGYPHGSARNENVEGDGTGFPLEEQWVNDLLGWQQALLAMAGITPSEVPDTALASDYLDAILTIVAFFDYRTAQTVVRAISPLGFVGPQTPSTPYYQAWRIETSDGTNPKFVGSENNVYGYQDLDKILVHEATITQLAIRCKPGTGGPDVVSVSLRRKQVGVTGQNWAIVGSAVDSVGTADQIVTVPLSHIVDKTAYSYAVFLVDSGDPSGADLPEYHGGTLTMSVPGLRP